jgi:hypothetical protein
MRQHEQAQDRKGQRQNPTEAYLSAKPASHASNTIYQLPFLKLQSNDCEHLAVSDPALRSPRNSACSIEMANHFPQREQFWLERLVGYEGDALFICGDGHVETFGRLLERKRIEYKVVERGIGVTDEDRQRFQELWIIWNGTRR